MTAPTIDTLSPSLTIGGTGLNNKGIGRARTLQYAEFDIAAAVANGLTSAHSFKLIHVPANTHVVIHDVWNVTTLVMTSFGLGDSADIAQWVSANSTTTINTYATIANSTKSYAAADGIYVKITSGTSGTVGIFYELIDISRDAVAVVP